VGLALTLLPSILTFYGTISLENSKIYMFIGTIIWFVSAPTWMNKSQVE
jgi:hypothetical protein